jgi:hypothetical protein
MKVLRALAVVPAILAAAAVASADEYGGWKKDETRKVYACEYKYEKRDGGYSTQTVAIYYADKDRAGWAYYYNAKNEPWARCAAPGNPKYDAKVMYWEQLKPDGSGYQQFKDSKGAAQFTGYCPAPKDGKSPIPSLPIPPK